MNFKEKLSEYKQSGKRVLINGLGGDEYRGKILEVYDDFIDYELLQIKVENKSKKEKHTREVKQIQISQIFDLSEGEVEKEVNAFEKALGEVTQ